MGKIKTALINFGFTRGVVAVSLARMGDGVGKGILIVLFPLYVAQMDVSWLHVPESIHVGLGIAIGPLITGFLVIPFFQLPFITFTLLLLSGAWVVYRLVPETIKQEKRNNAGSFDKKNIVHAIFGR